MRRYRFSLDVIFHISEKDAEQFICTQPKIDDDVDCDCGECDGYFIDKLKEWLNHGHTERVEYERSTITREEDS